jgi:nitrogen fixation/metabolism regulation signal transduction histidine kinase
MNAKAISLFSVILLSASLLCSLVLMSGAIQNSAKFGSLYAVLLISNAFGILAFMFMIGRNIWILIQQLRNKEAGSRLTLRMVTLFTILAVVPVTILYGFSLDFLRRGVDSWFDLRVSDALSDSLELGRESLDLSMRQLLILTEKMADEISEIQTVITPLHLGSLKNSSISTQSDSVPTPSQLDTMRSENRAEELILLNSEGVLIASSSATGNLVPNLPPESIRAQVRQGQSYIGLDPIRDGNLSVRVAVKTNIAQNAQSYYTLHALYPFSNRINMLAASVEASYEQYTELSYLREKLKVSFAMTLTLVLLFSIVTSVWAAFYSARRLSAPIRELAEGTAAIARGDYTKNLPVESSDEIGFLVSSFNSMTTRIAKTREEIESQREYLDTLLSQLSSGVIALTAEKIITTLNPSARNLLGIQVSNCEGKNFTSLRSERSDLGPITEQVLHQMDKGKEYWQAQVVILDSESRKELVCKGTTVKNSGGTISGYVIVLEDITAIVQGQRDAAWSEVAKRLAHEIKNPLTPIQLATERLRLKYLNKLGKEDGELLVSLTDTIIEQVEAMKTMVNSFTDYASSTQKQKNLTDTEKLLKGVVELFRSTHPSVNFIYNIEPDLPKILINVTRIRQVFNNLVKNALEASPDDDKSNIIISIRLVDYLNREHVEIGIEDQGSGVPEKILGSVFDPYVTSKTKGNGLGLAIVKKIIEEHDGMVTLRNKKEQGAIVLVRIPSPDIKENPSITLGSL